MFRRLKKYYNEKGQVAVLAIFIFFILCGFAGLAIDTWLIVYNKQLLQNALDLSVLAATQEAMNTPEQVVSTAIKFAKKNGIEADTLTITHPYKGDDNKVAMFAHRTINLVFMPIFGKKTKTISTKAVAELIQGDTDQYIFDYAIFSGDENNRFKVSGSNITVKGNTHINGDSMISGSNIHFDGRFESVGSMKGASKVYFKNLIQSAQVLPMIEMDMEPLKLKANTVYNRSKTFSNSKIDLHEIMFIDGDVKISGSHIKGTGTIIADGDIHISGSNFVYNTEDEFVCLYASGDIKISGSNIKVEGVLYAPNGTIQISGSKNTFKGALIAKNFENISGSNMMIEYDERAKNIMESGSTVTRLID